MGSSFNPQILVEKLAKLNPSQASIETLSHWCIFHMNKAKQVVETWDRQFHCSPREQRLAFLYLANDILQNSRRKGSEFVGEFWKVLPGALSYVIDSGDEAGRSSALRLINIWEDRKVFGSRVQTLKDEIMGKHQESSNRNGKHVDLKLKQPAGSALDKIISGYQVVHSGQVDEDAIINKCRSAIICFEKAEKEVDSNTNSGQYCRPAFAVELQGQHAILRDSINQLTALELSRASLVSQLREALQEEESKLEQIRNQLQAAQSQLGNANKLCQQLVVHSSNVNLVTEESSKEVGTSIASKSFTPGDRDQSAPAMYRRQASFPEKSNHVEEDPRKSAAAAVAAKLTASTSSAQMLSYVLSSLASEGVIGNSVKESAGEYQPEKRAKLDNDQPYIPSQNPAQPPLSTFQHPEPYQIATTGQQLTLNDPPPPPSSPPPLPPLPPMPAYSVPQYLQTAGSINAAQYGYSISQQQPPSLTGYPGVGTQMTGISPFTVPASNSYQSYQGSDGNLYTQQSSMPMVPISRQ